jgi:hypothetical protein
MLQNQVIATFMVFEKLLGLDLPKQIFNPCIACNYPYLIFKQMHFSYERFIILKYEER